MLSVVGIRRILKESQAEHWVSSSFDALGLRTEMRSSLGASLHIQRGVMGDVASVEEQSGFRATFARDQMGLEVERTLPGGVRSRWQRDALGRPLQHTTDVASIALRAVSYQWDVNDRLRGVVDAQRGPTQYQHDPLGNLVSARYPDGQGELRVADAVGNLFKREDQKDRAYGPAGELLAQSTQHGQITYRYDPEGNLVEKREPDGRTWRYHWNLAGMLQSVLRPDGDEVTFGYDPLGRRVRKTYRGQSTKWVWDGNVPLHEWVEGALEPREDEAAKTAGHAARPGEQRDADLRALLAQTPAERGLKAAPITWLFEPESFSPLAKLVGQRQYSIVTDHLGTPVLMLDDAGERVWSASTSVFGALRDIEGARHACPFRWPGQYEDAETGLYYNRFRYYDLEAGQYVAQDPIRLAGGFELYAYVQDPLTWVDPLGLSGEGPYSPPLTADELRGKSRTEIAQLAANKELIPTGTPDVKSGLPKKWKDPVNGKERLRQDRGHVDTKTGKPYDDKRAAVDHVHGYEPDGSKIGPSGFQVVRT